MGKCFLWKATSPAARPAQVDMLGRAIGILEKNLKSNSFAQISKTNLNELTQALTVVMKVRAGGGRDGNQREQESQ